MLNCPIIYPTIGSTAELKHLPLCGKEMYDYKWHLCQSNLYNRTAVHIFTLSTDETQLQRRTCLTPKSHV